MAPLILGVKCLCNFHPNGLRVQEVILRIITTYACVVKLFVSMRILSIEMLTLPSCPENICKLEEFVDQIARKYNINSEIYGNMLISLTEAVTNAIRHGNNYDENKVVKINLQIRKNRLAFSVSDEGKGFDYQNVPDPTTPENILKIGGRGVFLMKQLADCIAFHDHGRTVEMEFCL